MRWIRKSAASVLVVVACGSGAAPTTGNVLRWATNQQVRTLDPDVGNDEVSIYVIHDVYDTLVGYEPADPARAGSGLKLVPHLASSWTVSSDHLDYVFTLRDGITYEDGTRIVAADFVTSLDRARHLGRSAFASYLGDVDQVRAPDDTHVEITLKRSHPYAGFLYVMAMPFATPLPAARLDAVGDEIRRAPLASGPWRLVRWDEGQTVELAKNPRYWDASRVKLDGQILLENIPSDTAYLMFEQGELDAVDRLPSPVYVWIQDQAKWKPYIHAAGAMNTYGERMNVTVPPFTDVRVRRALNYAVNKDHIVKLLGGGAVVSHGILPPGMFGRDDSLAPYPYDPAKARALLAAAGYPHGFEMDYLTTTGDDAEKLALSVQADLAAVGVTIKIRQQSFATYLGDSGSPKGTPFSIDSWIEDYPDPSDFVDVKFASSSISDENSNNDVFWSDPKLDAMMSTARYEIDEGKRADEYKAIERYLYDQAPWIWEYHRRFIEVTQPWVRGYQPHPVWLRDYTDTSIDRSAR
jgi:ABC-type transport system substrate-binding protein